MNEQTIKEIQEQVAIAKTWKARNAENIFMTPEQATALWAIQNNALNWIDLLLTERETMQRSIEQLIEDYQRRVKATIKMMMGATDVETIKRLEGKKQAFSSILMELKTVLKPQEGES